MLTEIISRNETFGFDRIQSYLLHNMAQLLCCCRVSEETIFKALRQHFIGLIFVGKIHVLFDMAIVVRAAGMHALGQTVAEVAQYTYPLSCVETCLPKCWFEIFCHGCPETSRCRRLL
jgi:hypothetical protein